MADDNDPAKNQPPGYVPAEVWTPPVAMGGKFGGINRPTAGARHEAGLPVGKHPLQLYSLATPNGVKVTILLEELLALGHSGAEYDAWLINIMDSDQFGSGFVAVNPNSKIPAMLDRSGPVPVRLFESGSILFYLAEKFGEFLPREGAVRAETMNWLMWQMGAAPLLGGGFGHFYHYAPFRIEYAIDRFTMELKRQLDVLNRNLAERRFITGESYTIADMAIFPWYGMVVSGEAYNAGRFLSVEEYPHVLRWCAEIAARPAVQRGRMVNRGDGPADQRLRERHDARDFEINRDDMVEARGGVRL